MSRKNSGGFAAKGPSQRQLRVGEEIRHALADIFRRGEFRDPVLMDLNVTVSEVRVSPDLKNATAFVMPLGGRQPELVAALNRASAFLRSQVAAEVRLPHAPRLSFQLDTSFDYADKIGRILHDPHVAQDLGAEAAEDEDVPDTEELDGEGVPLDREDRLEDGDADESRDDQGDGRHGA
ncbi:30S ribosome-binding factor RbfA [Aerophototrophica crusticola]|uniref:Ribosome-binding factor A n=1 Tax=Aerophototrophica crusticola TaxID=1709002 RepID=A0A858R337_9PROT|nr:30S ribosome-binding factor RbfA [Rhodospirillaceae bacterium B3]